MIHLQSPGAKMLGRRRFLIGGGLVGAATLSDPAWAQQVADLAMPGGPRPGRSLPAIRERAR
ncbi:MULTISPECIES: hypothetical protein [Brevundimonas]|uniref:hypothetical protein n=1 Tax=Brevundimonas TaxID=41275 RepID=UPI001A9E468B|nr:MULTISPECIES: hypothetical protein [Brevundimonas]